MIKLNNVIIEPTIFPDGTSQVWNICESNFLNISHHYVDWLFESEREIFDLFSLKDLLIKGNVKWSIHIPYLPYARQDKEVSNYTTFNLLPFSKMLNSLNFESVSCIDVHNPVFCKKNIVNFKNISVKNIHTDLIDEIKPDAIVYPDEGAFNRYHEWNVNTILFHKVRDGSSGNIIKHEIASSSVEICCLKKLLIIDDICDGGRTFLSISKKIKEINSTVSINLFVTHGIFSNGIKQFIENDIKLYTTDSFIRKAHDDDSYLIKRCL